MHARVVAGLLVLALVTGCISVDGGSRDALTREPDEPDRSRERDRGPTGPVFGNHSWSDGSDAPVARAHVATANVADRVYAVGGYSTVGPDVLPPVPVITDRVDVYDAGRDTWSRAPDYPVPVHHAAATAKGDVVYVLGGYEGPLSTPTDAAYRYDPDQGTWEALPPLPTPRAAHGAGVVHGMVVVAGGVNANGTLLADVHAFDPELEEWLPLPDLPTPRERPAVITVGNALYTVGGREAGEMSPGSVVEAYAHNARVWVPLADLPTPRSGGAGAVLDRHVVVAGGDDGRDAVATVEAFSLSTREWVPLPDLPTARTGLGATTVNGRVLTLLGGPDASFSGSPVVESWGPPER